MPSDAPFTSSTASGTCMAMKMPQKSAATSPMGASEKARGPRFFHGRGSTLAAARPISSSSRNSCGGVHPTTGIGLPGCTSATTSAASTSSSRCHQPTTRKRVGREVVRGASRRCIDASIAAYSASSVPTVNNHGFHRLSVQVNGTPRRNPRNSGGSPIGSRHPPTLLTRKMKNTTVCTRCVRCALARSTGRISSMLAPVVPSRFASTAPSASMLVLAPVLPGM